MSFMEMLPEVHALPRIDKLRLIQLLAEDPAQAEETSLLAAGQTYPVWSPDRAYDGAAVLLGELETERSRL